MSLRATSILGLLAVLLSIGCPGDDLGPVRLALGATCTGGGDAVCASGYCAKLDTGSRVCTVPCNSAVTCPMGWACREDSDPPLCVPVASSRRCVADGDCPMAHVCSSAGPCVVPGQRGLCESCSGPEQCGEGFDCERPQPGAPEACLNRCEKDLDCGEGSCSEGLCRPSAGCGRGSDLCKPCVTDVECGSQADFCVRNLLTGDRHCASACTVSEDCPGGFICQAFEGGQQCVPLDGRCENRCLGDEACSDGFQCVDGRCARRGGFEGLCAPCSNDGECADGLCLENPAQGLRACAPYCGEDGTCPEGGACLSLDDGTALCVPRTGQCPVGVGSIGSRCHHDRQCRSGLCLLQAETDRGGRCVAQCPCGPDERCEALDDGLSVCLPAKGNDGDRCTHSLECEGSFCLHLATESVCSRPCETKADCGGGWVCSATSGGLMACLPETGGGALGADCSLGPVACSGGRCLVRTGGAVCTVVCGGDGDCPAGWACRMIDGRGSTPAEQVCSPVEAF